MEKKITWNEIYKDFRSRHPTSKNLVMDWRPYDILTIKIKLSNGLTLAYNYDTKWCKVLARE